MESQEDGWGKGVRVAGGVESLSLQIVKDKYKN